MGMIEVEITFKNLFDLIEEEENTTYELEREYFQKTPIEIKDENNNWIPIKGLITKDTETVELELDNKEKIIAATHHIIQRKSYKFCYVGFLNVGDVLRTTNGDYKKITGITKLGNNKVYDIEVDNPTHLYQCSLGLVHHNTLLTAGIIKYANKLNMRTITIVPSSSLLKQTHDYVKQFEIPVGMFGAGKKDDKPNIVATWQTLQNNMSFIRDFHCIIWDECVHPSSKIRMADNSEKRIDEINVGDEVKTLNEKTHQIENKPVVKIHKNLLKSNNQQMFKITMEDDSEILLTGNHKVLTYNGWKQTDELTMDDEIISLAEQFDYHLIELFLKKKWNTTVSEWFGLTPTTISRWKKVIPKKYIDEFKQRTNIKKIVDLIKEIY